MAKSYDWNLSHGMIVVNKRGVEKTSLSILPTDKQLSWTSKLGSVSFNQYGREFPLGGMNEKGLMAEVLWLNESDYPEANEKASLNELQWVQYILDNAENLAEAKALANSVRISAVYAAVHYLICDQQKKCGTFEYLNGELVVNSYPRILAPTITNNTYAASETYLKKYLGFGGNKSLPTGFGSLDRFSRASILAKNFDRETQKNMNASDYALEVLDSVATGTYSKWNIVYNQRENSIILKNRFGARTKMKMKPQDFDYSCSTDVLVHDIDSTDSGDIQSKFRSYSRSDNFRIVKKSLQGDFPGWLINTIIAYPETNTRCVSSL